MKALVYSKKGNKKGEIVLNPEIFAARVNARLLELIRNAYSANLRHGTHDTKTHKEVSGGGKKPWKQKGTGRARQGSTRSAQWRGGGTVFGPHPRSYYVNLPKTMRRQALISAFSFRGDQKNIIVLESAQLDSPKTKEWAEIVKSLPLEGKRALCVVKDLELNLQRASQNMLNQIDVRRASDVNAFDVLQREKIILEQDAIAVIEGRILNQVSGAQVEAGTEVKAEKAAPKTKSKKETAKRSVKKSSVKAAKTNAAAKTKGKKK